MPGIKNIQELILTAAARWGGRPAFRHIAGRQVFQYRYRELPDLSSRMAQSLYEKGLRFGDYVAVWADNSPEWAIACLSVFRIGAIVVPLDHSSRLSEVSPVIDKVKPKLILVGQRQYAQAVDQLSSRQLIRLDSLLGADPQPAIPPFKSPDSSHIAMVMFTCGSNSTPKGVVLTHGNVLSSVSSITGALCITSRDRVLSVLPRSQMLEFIIGFLVPLQKGATIVYGHSKPVTHLRRLLKFERISILLGTPVIFQKLLAPVGEPTARSGRSAPLQMAMLRRIVSTNPAFGRRFFAGIHHELGGVINFWIAQATSQYQDVAENLRSFGIPMFVAYGLEGPLPIVAVKDASQRKLEGVGHPVAGVEVRIDKPDVSGSGEILVSGPQVMSRYFEDELETTRVFRGGWLRTGDSGYLDDNGSLHVVGRSESMIVISDDRKVYPEEVESLLSRSPLVKESCLLALGDVDARQLAVVIVPDDKLGARCGGNSLVAQHELHQELDRCLRDLADYKRPSTVVMWDRELPRDNSGALLRQEVARSFDGKPRKKARSQVLQAQFNWDSVGEAVCDGVAGVMDPEILRGVCPSGSNFFLPDVNLAEDLGLDSFSRLELTCRLEKKLSIHLSHEAIQEAQTLEDLVMLARLSRSISDVVADHAGEPAPAVVVPLLKTYPWPPIRFGSRLGPLRDEPLVVAGRKSAIITLKAFMTIFCNLQIEGADRLLIDPPYIVAATSVSNLDALALLTSFPPGLLRLVRAAGSADDGFADAWQTLISSYLLNVVPFYKSAGLDNSLNQCEEHLKDGGILIVLPEGSDRADGSVAEFKLGAARLSIRTGCPIIPTHITGTHRRFSLGELKLKAEPVRIEFGLPVYPPAVEANRQSCVDLTARLRLAIEALRSGGNTADVTP